MKTKSSEFNNIRRITQELPVEKEERENPVYDCWDIQLLYGMYDNEDERVFYVGFKSLLTPEERKIYSSISELYGNNKALKNNLRRIGCLKEHKWEEIVDFIEYLMETRNYSELNLNPEEHKNISKSLINEGKKYYNVLTDYVKESIEVFPEQREKYIKDETEGLLIEENGYKKIIIERESLETILNIYDKAQIDTIIRTWKDKGLILSGNDEVGKLTHRYTFTTGYRKNAYFIKFDEEYVKGSLKDE